VRAGSAESSSRMAASRDRLWSPRCYGTLGSCWAARGRRGARPDVPGSTADLRAPAARWPELKLLVLTMHADAAARRAPWCTRADDYPQGLRGPNRHPANVRGPRLRRAGAAGTVGAAALGATAPGGRLPSAARGALRCGAGLSTKAIAPLRHQRPCTVETTAPAGHGLSCTRWRCSPSSLRRV
jgi:hypothetical protein